MNVRSHSMGRASESSQGFRDTSQQNHPVCQGRHWSTNPSSHDAELLSQDGAQCSERTSGEKKISVMCLSRSKGSTEVNVGQSQRFEQADVANFHHQEWRLSPRAGFQTLEEQQDKFPISEVPIPCSDYFLKNEEMCERWELTFIQHLLCAIHCATCSAWQELLFCSFKIMKRVWRK